MTSNQNLSFVSDAKQSNISIEDNNQKHVTDKHEYSLEDAIDATKIGKYQKLLILTTGLSIMGAGIENVSFSYIVPFAKCDLNLTMAEQGALTSVSFLGIVSTSYFWGFLADTWGRQKVLSLSALCGFTFSFMSAFSTNTTILIVLRFLAGSLLAGCQAGAFSYISEFHTSKTAARAVSFASMCLSAMALYMSPIAMLVLPLDWTWHIFSLNFRPWRLFLICMSFVNLFNGIVFAFLPESPKFLLAINEKEKALQVLRRVYAFNTGQPEETYPVQSIKAESMGNNLAATKGFCNIMRLLWSQTKPIFLAPLLTHTWKLCYLIFAIFAIGHGTFMWFPDFLVQLQNYKGPAKVLCSVVEPKPKTDDFDNSCANLDNKNITSYIILLGIGISFFITAASASYLIKYVSPKVIICSWLSLSAIACIALNFLTEYNSIVLSFVIFLSCCTCANLVMAVAVNLFPTTYRGMATAFILMCGRIGGFSGSNQVGFLLSYNCDLIFYINAGLLISCTILVSIMKTSNQSKISQNNPKL